MTKYFCDKCKEEIGFYGEKYKLTYKMDFNIKSSKMKYIICKECMSKIVEFIEGGNNAPAK